MKKTISGYSGKKVLVTGADGFIGSHLVEGLVTAGADVKAFCFYNSQGSWGWLDHSKKEVLKNTEFILGDIRDKGFAEKALKGVDVVFHLAALIAIPYSYSAPESFVDTNVKGTLNILEASLKNGVKRIVHTSTSEVYGTPDAVPITEEHKLKGQSPYSASKIAADKLCEAFHCSFGLPVVTLRPFNTYGPRQSARAVIPTIITQLLAGRKELHLGNLKPRRDLVFVDDTVDGFLRAGLAGKIEGQVIQLGTGRTYSVGEIAETAMKSLGVRAAIRTEKKRLRPDASEVMILLSDPSKAKRMLRWEHRTELMDGIGATASWLGENLKHYKTGIYQV
ncbi:MAG TPA: SDR family NAD(P)-dependent oxidoreductase [Acidobacteriota bacterium]|nr:SDR family NAD(P)-dependent oxidoreductase [Acidobacteriota bacterium]HNT17614.1 SDR family NAD(P)-dependent oxidoreductase [Acidobacteriota bacterium]